RHQRSQSGHDCHQSRRQGASRKHALRRPQEPLRSLRSLSAASRRRELHFAAKLAFRNRRQGPECPPLLQRRRSRPQHHDSAVPIQHLCQHARLQASRILRSHRARRARSSQSQLQHSLSANGVTLRVTKRMPRRRFLLYLITLLYFLYLPPSIAVVTKQLRIERFDEEVVVMPNGSVDVTENIRARFIGGHWNGLYRTIPIEYVTPQGLNYTLFLDIQNITDGEG